MAGKEVNIKVWMSPFQHSEEDSTLKVDVECMQELNATACSYPNSSPPPPGGKLTFTALE